MRELFCKYLQAKGPSITTWFGSEMQGQTAAEALSNFTAALQAQHILASRIGDIKYYLGKLDALQAQFEKLEPALKHIL